MKRYGGVAVLVLAQRGPRFVEKSAVANLLRAKGFEFMAWVRRRPGREPQWKVVRL